MSLVYDRKTQKISEEPQYGGGSLNFLYKNAIGRLMLRFFVGHLFSNINAALNKTKRSQQKIAPFIEKYHIDASAYNLDDFDSFASFFTRQNLSLKPVLAKNIFISPAQAKLSVYKITKGQTITIKNSQYSIEDLIGEKSVDNYRGGNCFVYRLAMDDYHRYCYVDNGEIIRQKHIKGKLHTVSSISSDYKIFAQNDRICNFMHTDNFGDIIQVEVGAILVGRIRNHDNTVFKKGSEKGYFELGGSTIVIITKNNIQIDEDILQNSSRGIETKINYGERVGKKC